MEGKPSQPQENIGTTERPPFFESTVGQYENNEQNHLSLETAYGRIDMTSDIGGPESKYKSNEDSGFTVATQESVALGVIDGVGGQGEGLLASIAANRTFREELSKGKDIEYSFHEADRRLREMDKGCFAAAAGAEIKKVGEGEYEVKLFGIGDSKITCFRDGQSLPGATTKFQNSANHMLEGTGMEDRYYVHPLLATMNTAMGVKDKSKSLPQFIPFNGKSGDVLVAATDGMWDNVSEYEVIQMVQKHEGDAKKIQEELFNLAMERNNSKEFFKIQHDENHVVEKSLYSTKHPTRFGDNVTVAVMRLA